MYVIIFLEMVVIMKKEIITPVGIFIIICVLALCKLLFFPNQRKVYNHNKSFVQVQEQDGILFKNIKCYYDGKESLITYTISNHTDNDIELKNLEIYVKDKNDKVISKIFMNTNLVLSSNEEKKIENKVLGKDLSNAYKMELKTDINHDNDND